MEEITNKIVQLWLYVHNQSAIKLIKNGVFNKRSTHFDVWSSVSENTWQGKIHVSYGNMSENVADILQNL